MDIWGNDSVTPSIDNLKGKGTDMTKESANQFLEDVAFDNHLRAELEAATNPQEFAQVAQSLGYTFTPEELKEVVKEHSEGVTRRRTTGVWQWLRTVHWI